MTEDRIGDTSESSRDDLINKITEDRKFQITVSIYHQTITKTLKHCYTLHRPPILIASITPYNYVGNNGKSD